MAEVDGASGSASGGAGIQGGLVRDRLVSRLTDPATFRVGWVVAPAGSGKSRLLAHVAHSFEGPVAWCGTPDPVPRTEAAMVRWLWPGLDGSGAVDAMGGEPPESVSGLVAMAATSSPPVLVVADDVHLLEGSDTEGAMSELIGRLPPSWRLLMASRVSLGFDLSRMRVSGDVVDIGPDDLRFRTWEVEALFRDIYRDPLLPEDVAALARRTAGWAAYLQLFFLATARKPQGERRLVLGSLQNRTRLVSEYLGRHALAGLEPEIQDFLLRTSVLRRPTPGLCDEFLGRSTGSRDLLAELERRQIFTERIDDEGYRYHAVLLSYLDAKLVETIGLGAAKAEHQRAGRLLEREGWAEEALAAYVRAEDWDSVGRVLGQAYPSTGTLGEAWIEALPPSLVESDPLLLMVRANRDLARGDLIEAARVLRRAESVAASAVVAERCRDEREQILVWAEPTHPRRSDWIGVIRAATQRQPVQAQRLAASLPGVSGRFAEGCAALLAGDYQSCARLMRAIAPHPDSSPIMVGAAAVLGVVAAFPAGRQPDRDEIERMLEEVDASGVRWLGRLARAALTARDPAGDDALDDLISACERDRDQWGAALIAGLAGIGRLSRRDPASEASFVYAARTFSELGAGVLEASQLGFAALSAFVGGRTDAARALAGQARTLGGLHDAPEAAGLSALVLALLSADERELARPRDLFGARRCWDWYAALAGMDASDGSAPSSGADAAAHQVDAVGPDAYRANGTSAEPAGAPVAIQCLGGYGLIIGGRAVDESGAKPMERALLHLLSIKAGEPVHREELIAALWPEADGEAGLHRLQVAVSSLRRLLGAACPEGGGVLARSGDSYQLVLPAGSDVDVARFERALREAAAARVRVDQRAEADALAAAMDIYSGPLLPGDGPSEWVLGPRRRLEGAYTDAAARLAALRLEADPQGAVHVARAGLATDRYRDDLWKVLIEASERAGHHADAERARQNYEAVLTELGV